MMTSYEVIMRFYCFYCTHDIHMQSIRKRDISIILVLLMSFFILSCAKRQILIDSSPSNAEVYINNVKRGQTPLHVECHELFVPVNIPKYIIRVEKNGYFSFSHELINRWGIDSFPNTVFARLIDRPGAPIDENRPTWESKGLTSSLTFKSKEINTGTSWALIIGVSNYKDKNVPPLQYSSRDAKLFYNYLVSTSGGRFERERVKLLIDEKATAVNIRMSLFEWLRQALEEDVVIIYFAGHGSSDSPDSQNLFLLPYDANYNNIASTAFPMWDIETALKRFLKAKRVIVLADACHAGGIGSSFDISRRAGRAIKVNPVNEGLKRLADVGRGICVFTSSDDRQYSQESDKWGGGQGVFTYYLLKGLQGEADYNRDQNITLGELIPYVSEKVRRETSNAQSPTVSGKFDPSITIQKSSLKE